MKHRNYSIKRMARRKTSDETSQNETGRREHRFEWAIFVSTHVRSIEARWTPPRNGCWFGGQSVIRRSASMASTASIHLGETAAWRWPCTRRPWHGIPARKSHRTPLAAGRSETRADKKLGTKLGKGAGGAARGRWARRPKTKQSAESIALWPVRRQLTAAASAINTTDTHALALAHTHTHTHTHAHSHTHTRARWHSRGSSSSSSNAFTRILVILLESKIAVWSEWGREVVPGGGAPASVAPNWRKSPGTNTHRHSNGPGSLLVSFFSLLFLVSFSLLGFLLRRGRRRHRGPLRVAVARRLTGPRRCASSSTNSERGNASGKRMGGGEGAEPPPPLFSNFSFFPTPFYLPFLHHPPTRVQSNPVQLGKPRTITR